jgi:hypothetical protein
MGQSKSYLKRYGKNWETSQKFRKIGWIVNQAPALGPKHDIIRAQWISNILWENMLKRVWWCRCSEMEPRNWTNCHIVRVITIIIFFWTFWDFYGLLFVEENIIISDKLEFFFSHMNGKNNEFKKIMRLKQFLHLWTHVVMVGASK